MPNHDKKSLKNIPDTRIVYNSLQPFVPYIRQSTIHCSKMKCFNLGKIIFAVAYAMWNYLLYEVCKKSSFFPNSSWFKTVHSRLVLTFFKISFTAGLTVKTCKSYNKIYLFLCISVMKRLCLDWYCKRISAPK